MTSYLYEAPLITPALTARLAPASCYRISRDRYWRVYNQDRAYGQLLYKPEADYVLNHFGDRAGVIEVSEFDPVAERAVALFAKKTGAAS